MASPNPFDLGAIFGKAGSAAEQLFIWAVMQQLVSAAMAPLITEVTQFTQGESPVLNLSPEQLADLVTRGHISQDQAQAQAQQAGITNSLFNLLVLNAGNPIAPDQAAEALRRGLIQNDNGDPNAPGFIQAIAQSRLQIQWAEVVKALDLKQPTPDQVALGAVRNNLGGQDPRALFALFGGDPTWYDLIFNNIGEGPSPVEAGVLANRGIIPWDGVGPDATSFAQAVAESRFKTKWEAGYRALAVYLPPPRTVTAMYREGSLDLPTATRLLLDYGVTEAEVPLYLTQGRSSAFSTVHTATESLIVQLYEEQALTAQQTHDLLSKHGYADEDITLILQQADIQALHAQETAAIAVVKSAFLKGHISYNDASTTLDQNHVPPGQRDYLLSLWNLELQAGIKQLTPKEITDALGTGVIDVPTAQAKMKANGYTASDAAIILLTALAGSGQASVVQELEGLVGSGGIGNLPIPTLQAAPSQVATALGISTAT